ncbi:hypothetical protein PHJA_001362400 [Phtheirospermum japonicum]|uniref:Uncharacterized protein n=1 Tax=Phtheirospermum japonicum TaxID=374723 RepID=A0A830C807_9LAMI|nr:hypothetical protein PHJA_001362400 [Phtheirospermum japonicum]
MAVGETKEYVDPFCDDQVLVVDYSLFRPPKQARAFRTPRRGMIAASFWIPDSITHEDRRAIDVKITCLDSRRGLMHDRVTTSSDIGAFPFPLHILPHFSSLICNENIAREFKLSIGCSGLRWLNSLGTMFDFSFVLSLSSFRTRSRLTVRPWIDLSRGKDEGNDFEGYLRFHASSGHPTRLGLKRTSKVTQHERGAIVGGRLKRKRENESGAAVPVDRLNRAKLTVKQKVWCLKTKQSIDCNAGIYEKISYSDKNSSITDYGKTLNGLCSWFGPVQSFQSDYELLIRLDQRIVNFVETIASRDCSWCSRGDRTWSKPLKEASPDIIGLRYEDRAENSSSPIECGYRSLLREGTGFYVFISWNVDVVLNDGVYALFTWFKCPLCDKAGIRRLQAWIFTVTRAVTMFRRKPHNHPEINTAERDAEVKQLRGALGSLSGRNLKYCSDACLRRYLEA